MNKKEYRLQYVIVHLARQVIVVSINSFQNKFETQNFVYPKPILLLYGQKDLVVP